MKNSLLFVLLFIFTTVLNASAMRECRVVADLLSDTGSRQTIRVLKAEFTGGHSMGKDCRYKKGDEIEISIANEKPARVAKGSRITLLNRVVINMMPEARRSERWMYTESEDSRVFRNIYRYLQNLF